MKTKLLSPAVTIAVTVILLGVRFFTFIWRNSVNVLFFDQWDFLQSFFGRTPGITELFLWQHGPHRQGIGLIADRFLYQFTHWNVRVESLMIGVILFVAMILALWLKVQLFGQLQYADAIIPAIFLTLAQYETMVGTLNPSHGAFPLLLFMLYCGALARRRFVLLLLLNFLLIFTGFGFFVGPITIAFFARQYLIERRVGAAACLLIAAASLASFFIGYRWQPASDCFISPPADLLDYPWFVALMFASWSRLPLALTTILGSALAVAALAILTGLARHLARWNPAELTVAILLTFGLVFSLNTAAGRACLPMPETALAQRYITLMIPALLGLYFYTRMLPFRWVSAVAVGTLAAILAAGYIHEPRGAAMMADAKRAWVACFRSTLNIGYCDRSTRFPVYPDPARTHLQEKLDFLRRNRLTFFAD